MKKAAATKKQTEMDLRFLRDVAAMKARGVSEREIARRYDLSVSDLRTAIVIVKQKER